jgi:hypothetical protein
MEYLCQNNKKKIGKLENSMKRVMIDFAFSQKKLKKKEKYIYVGTYEN